MTGSQGTRPFDSEPRVVLVAIHKRCHALVDLVGAGTPSVPVKIHSWERMGSNVKSMQANRYNQNMLSVGPRDMTDFVQFFPLQGRYMSSSVKPQKGILYLNIFEIRLGDMVSPGCKSSRFFVPKEIRQSLWAGASLKEKTFQSSLCGVVCRVVVEAHASAHGHNLVGHHSEENLVIGILNIMQCVSMDVS